MSDEEILNSLWQCSTGTKCNGCPFFRGNARCLRKLMGAAAQLIENQKERISQLEQGKYTIEQAEQWLNDMDNPLEPIKVASALNSELLKFEIRRKERPQDISILDWTVIACLKKELDTAAEKAKRKEKNEL